jgi:hypothetical protein
MRSFRLAAPLLVLPAVLAAQAATPWSDFDFSIRNIMRGPELHGRAPTNVRWSADGRWRTIANPARPGNATGR